MVKRLLLKAIFNGFSKILLNIFELVIGISTKKQLQFCHMSFSHVSIFLAQYPWELCSC